MSSPPRITTSASECHKDLSTKLALCTTALMQASSPSRITVAPVSVLSLRTLGPHKLQRCLLRFFPSVFPSLPFSFHVFCGFSSSLMHRAMKSFLLHSLVTPLSVTGSVSPSRPQYRTPTSAVRCFAPKYQNKSLQTSGTECGISLFIDFAPLSHCRNSFHRCGTSSSRSQSRSELFSSSLSSLHLGHYIYRPIFLMSLPDPVLYSYRTLPFTSTVLFHLRLYLLQLQTLNFFSFQSLENFKNHLKNVCRHSS